MAEVIMLSLVLQVIVLGALLWRALGKIDLAGQRQQEALEAMRNLAATNLEHMAMMKGLAPHHVAPEKFTPAGVSWKTHEEAQKIYQENAGLTPARIEEGQVREAEAETYSLAAEMFGNKHLVEPEFPAAAAGEASRL